MGSDPLPDPLRLTKAPAEGHPSPQGRGLQTLVVSGRAHARLEHRAQRIRQVSKEVLQVNQGALYPALHRLEQSGWIKAKWGESDNNRRSKYYSLTAAGQKYLEQEQAHWKKLSAAIGLVLETS